MDENEKRSKYLSYIEKLWKNTRLSLEEKILLQSGFMFGFYGRMYGDKDEKTILRIKPYETQIWDHSLAHAFGMPGPDIEEFFVEDYGITWSLIEGKLK